MAHPKRRQSKTRTAKRRTHDKAVAYVAAMNGVDAIAFTAGIGENTSFVREKIMAYLGYLGIKIDRVTNDKTRGVEALISTADSSVKVCVIPTNEELAICRETVKLVG